MYYFLGIVVLGAILLALFVFLLGFMGVPLALLITGYVALTSLGAAPQEDTNKVD